MSRSRSRDTLTTCGTIGEGGVHIGDWWYTVYNTYPDRKSGIQEFCYDELHRGPPFNSGGPLLLHRLHQEDGTPRGQVNIWDGMRYADTQFIPFFNPTSDVLSQAGVQTFGQYCEGYEPDMSLGAKGWNKFRPTRPSVGLGQAIGEAKDIPRMLKTSAKSFSNVWRSMGGRRSSFGPKDVANEFLNQQFGWRPFINDLRGFYNTTSNLSKKLAQLKRDNNRWIRRGGVVATVEESETIRSSNGWSGYYPVFVTQLYNSQNGWVEWTRSFTRQAWFSAMFKYWIPYVNPYLWTGKAVAMLYELQPTPSLIYELTPWSWLVDWYSNLGDVLANLSSILYDNLVAKYAYLMIHDKRVSKFTGSADIRFVGDYPLTWASSIETKFRSGASPFGFGLTSNDFTARQWSILGALGISRLT